MTTSSIHSLSDAHEQHTKQSEYQSHSTAPANAFSNPDITSPLMPYAAAPAQLGVGNAQTAYPYPDPYYRSIFSPYETQSYPPQPTVMGIQPAGVVPLPTDAVEEPVFVNAKQYHGILRRRQSRAKAELENKLAAKSRKPYLHESRHLHALRRTRGVGGRFQKKNGAESKGNKSQGNFNVNGGNDERTQECD